jgi:hypothetical protein
MSTSHPQQWTVVEAIAALARHSTTQIADCGGPVGVVGPGSGSAGSPGQRNSAAPRSRCGPSQETSCTCSRCPTWPSPGRRRWRPGGRRAAGRHHRRSARPERHRWRRRRRRGARRRRDRRDRPADVRPQRPPCHGVQRRAGRDQRLGAARRGRCYFCARLAPAPARRCPSRPKKESEGNSPLCGSRRARSTRRSCPGRTPSDDQPTGRSTRRSVDRSRSQIFDATVTPDDWNLLIAIDMAMRTRSGSGPGVHATKGTCHHATPQP